MAYVDYNATTPIKQRAIDWMMEAVEKWGNPSSTHLPGRTALDLLDKSRRTVAEHLGASDEHVVFTSGGSESNNLAVLGSLFGERDLRLLTSKVEHSSIRDLSPVVLRLGGKVDWIRVLPTGELDLDELTKKIVEFRPHLVSLMTANNETGVLFPVDQISAICRNAGILFHTDAVQALGKVPTAQWNMADLISISAHKIGGPKGVGALLVRKKGALLPTHFGGSQEMKRRGGTHNMIGIAGLGGAISDLNVETNISKLGRLRDRFESLLKSLDGMTVNGVSAHRTPNTSNIRFHGISADVLLTALDLDGVSASAGSACFSGSPTPSHVLTAMGIPPEEAKECVRFSFGILNSMDEIDVVASTIIGHVNRIRARRHKSC